MNIMQSPSKSFLSYCLTFLLAVATVSLFEIAKIDTAFLMSALLVPVFFLILFWNNAKTRFVALVLLAAVLGVARYSIAQPATLAVAAHAPTFEAMVVREPDVRTDGVRYTLQKLEGAHAAELLYVSAPLYPRYAYQDTLALTCELERPEAFEDFRFDMYLASRGVFLTCTRPEISLVQDNSEKSFFGTLFQLKAGVADQINQLWPEPYAGFMAGLLYGYRGGLGTLQEDFNTTGVTHIIAISGYNITLVAVILLSLLIALRVRRQRAFWLVTVGIILFVLFVGASASVVRAGVMGILVLVARQMGRSASIANALALTAVVMTLWNPFVLLWDAGFQLSFLATLGLVYIAPMIERPCKRIPEAFGLRESVVATLAATVATLPLILFQFGRLSIVSPLVNVLILPMIPFIMSVGFIATLLSFVVYPIGQFVAYIALGGMMYIVTVVRWFADLPFASVELVIPGLVAVLLYVLIFLYISKKQAKACVESDLTATTRTLT